MYPTKNYTKQGGDETVIGGKLIFETGATVEGDGAADLSTVATDTTLGGVKAATKGAGDTVEVTVDEEGYLYVPAYPAAATPEAVGLVAQIPATFAGVASDITLPDLAAAYNALLGVMRTAGMIAVGGMGS